MYRSHNLNSLRGVIEGILFLEYHDLLVLGRE